MNKQLALATSVAALLACANLSIAAPITGPGQIVSATTTAPLNANNGGCTGPGGAGCTIDGDFTGVAGTFVEYAHQAPNTFNYQLNALYDIQRFLLWNDRGFPDSGIGTFDLIFKNNNAVVGSVLNLNAQAVFQGNNPVAEQFAVGNQLNVNNVDLVVRTPLGSTNVQFREIAFDGQLVPEPASLALLALGTLCVTRRR